MRETYIFKIIQNNEVKTRTFKNWIIACIYCWFVAPKELPNLINDISLGATKIEFFIRKGKKKC